jgi:hypothetical protein
MARKAIRMPKSICGCGFEYYIDDGIEPHADPKTVIGRLGNDKTSCLNFLNEKSKESK